MMSSLYIGATGMKSLSEGMSVVTNNLANVSTIGYKQQDVQFSDLIYEAQGSTGSSWGAQEDSYVALGQVGMGVQVDSVRTIFTQGTMESSNSVTDMAINGKGFFEVVTPEGQTMYTRAGNFNFDEEGYLSMPGGARVNGYPVNFEGEKGALEPIQIDPFSTMPSKATTEVSLGFNLGKIEDKSVNTTDPYFSLAQSYDGTAYPPLSEEQYSYVQEIQVYDEAGKAQTLTVYVDGAPAENPNNIMEFVVASNATVENPTGQALLAGTMTFGADGELVGINYFSPTGDSQDLNNWSPAAMTEDGSAQLNLRGQNISFDFGLKGTASGLAQSAADVGTNEQLLGTMGAVTSSTSATTAYSGSNSMFLREQDGYAEGLFTNLTVSSEGEIVGTYSNGQQSVLYEIPVARFVSEDGLYREGGNLYSATLDSGPAELGKAGTENFGTIHANYTEGSNVDMAAEMVDMIITQRGFQSNSKVVTTADEMLKKAMELKRT